MSLQSVAGRPATSGVLGGVQGSTDSPHLSSQDTSPRRCTHALRSVGATKGARCIHSQGHSGPHFFGAGS